MNSKAVFLFKQSFKLQNIFWFSKFLDCWKVMVGQWCTSSWSSNHNGDPRNDQCNVQLQCFFWCHISPHNLCPVTIGNLWWYPLTHHKSWQHAIESQNQDSDPRKCLSGAKYFFTFVFLYFLFVTHERAPRSRLQSMKVPFSATGAAKQVQILPSLQPEILCCNFFAIKPSFLQFFFLWFPETWVFWSPHSQLPSKISAAASQ